MSIPYYVVKCCICGVNVERFNPIKNAACFDCKKQRMRVRNARAVKKSQKFGRRKITNKKSQ